ncbi:sulfatase-like hydrolase/transferase [Persicobacter psychrovividus]|uniref:Arylsulfatase n=1 Tax=Persicobacter psychrovividus TaxID=387638 RepID=A0ABM7VMW3_9BACT|nr:arylsulfatase [Persicobacter psychrovividus]
MRNLFTIFLGLSLLINLQAKAEKRPPNVVFILIDDLSYLGVTAYGANRISSLEGLFDKVEFETPNIDRLAKEGIRVDNAFAYPICEPTRIALMSAKTNDRNFLRCKAQHSSDITFGDSFKKAGYATGIFGKWKQTRGSKEVAGKDYIFEFGWDEFTCFDVTTEGQRFINPHLIKNGTVTNYTGRKDLDPQTGRRWYGPDIVNRDALNFIDRHKDQPFFLYYPMLLVHDDHKPTPDTQPVTIFDEFDEANHNRNGRKGDDRRYFPDMIAYMDKLIGKVVNKLEEHQLRENTLIVVMGDNGTKECFAHILPDGSVYPGRKGGNADNGLHVPLVISQPSVIPTAKGQMQYRTYDGLTNITDIYPTLCEAVGIEMPDTKVDGKSLWSQVIGKSKKEHRDHIYTWFNGNSPYDDVSQTLVYAFDKNFKWYKPSREFPDGRFFDLRTDRLERKGEYYQDRRWKLRLFSGLDQSTLTPEQQEAKARLKKIVDSHEYVAVESLSIKKDFKKIRVGQQRSLSAKIIPANATRNNIIWESSDPTIASINKFGEIEAKQAGTVTIRLYSWDDAFPLSTNLEVTYLKNGIQDEVEINITEANIN